MNDEGPTRAVIERDFRRMLEDGDLPEPDEVLPHEDGGILCLWYAQGVSVVIDPS